MGAQSHAVLYSLYINSTRSDWLCAPSFLNYFESELFYQDEPFIKNVSLVETQKKVIGILEIVWVYYPGLYWILIMEPHSVNIKPVTRKLDPNIMFLKVINGDIRAYNNHPTVHLYTSLYMHCFDRKLTSKSIWIVSVNWQSMIIRYQLDYFTYSNME